MSWQMAGDYPELGSGSESDRDVIRVLVAETRTSARQAMCNLLSRCDDIVIVAQAKDGATVIQCVRELVPDVVLLSMRMPDVDSIDAVRHIAKAHPKARILVIGVPEDRPRVVEALRAGAVGHIPAADLPATLAVAVRRAAGGEVILETDVLLEVMAALRREASPPTGPAAQDLNPRNIGHTKLVARGAPTAPSA